MGAISSLLLEYFYIGASFVRAGYTRLDGSPRQISSWDDSLHATVSADVSDAAKTKGLC